MDLPGIIEGAHDGKGRGKQVIAVARTCDLIFICLDVLKPLTHKKILEHELENMGIRLNKEPPGIRISKKDGGGINYGACPPPRRALSATAHALAAAGSACSQSTLDLETVKAVLAEYRIASCDVRLTKDSTVDELIDAIEGNRVYIPAIYVLNKIDSITIEE